MSMKISPVSLFFIFYLCFGVGLYAQEEKPKVALVLSGGGAKGIAHIPLLQTLDSLGIVPDLVIGTSMGSVVGGFYAAGYSGDSIAYIAHHAEWSEILSGDVTLKDVGMEEKSEFKRQLVDFDVVNGKPMVNSGLLKDQKLREFFSSYTYPVYDIKDFDNLPIPYRAMSTDIVHGKERLFSKGSLNLAMRASMSIPGVFEPIRYDSTLLVDGGVLNNFPVNVAKDLGYDIIIGSDVGGGMQKIEKLNSIPALLFQAGMLTSNLKNPENRKLCNILIDHVPNLTYSTGDFAKSDEIYEEGKIGVAKQMDALRDLAVEMKKYKQRDHKLPDVKNEFKLDSIGFKGISEANLDLVKARANLQKGQSYSTFELIDAIERTMGTNLFSQVTWDPELDDNKLVLSLNGSERSQNVVKGSLHYDNYRSVGVMVNYTGRNLLGKASRIVVTADIAVQPRFRVQYQKLFGKTKQWWWRSEVLGEFLEQKFYFEGELAENMKSKYYQFENQFNRNFKNLKSYAGFGVDYKRSNIKPTLKSEINENLLGLEKYTFNNFEVDAHYQFNNFNEVFYPTSGMYLRARVARSFIHEVDINWSVDDFEDVEGPTNGFTKFNLDMEKRWKLSNTTTLIIGGNADFIFEDELKEDELSFSYFGHSGLYSLGGTVTQPRKDTFTFSGLHEDEVTVSQMMRVKVAAQINPFSKFFFTPHINLASVGFEDFDSYIKDAFTPDGSWSDAQETSLLFSTGINVGYNSFLGPINFDISYVNDVDKVRVFFNIGILFNRSN